MTVLKSLAKIFQICQLQSFSIFYIGSPPLFFLSVLSLGWSFSSLLAYYFKFTFDLKAILFFTKNGFIQCVTEIRESKSYHFCYYRPNKLLHLMNRLERGEIFLQENYFLD